MRFDISPLQNVRSRQPRGAKRYGLESAKKYWQQMTEKEMQAQVDVMRSMGHVLEQEKDIGMESPLAVFQAAIPPLASSFFPMNAHVPDGQALHS